MLSPLVDKIYLQSCFIRVRAHSRGGSRLYRVICDGDAAHEDIYILKNVLYLYRIDPLCILGLFPDYLTIVKLNGILNADNDVKGSVGTVLNENGVTKEGLLTVLSRLNGDRMAEILLGELGKTYLAYSVKVSVLMYGRVGLRSALTSMIMYTAL